MSHSYYLANILNALDAVAQFQIDVTLKDTTEEWTVWHNKLVGNFNLILSPLDCESVTTIFRRPTLVLRISVVSAQRFTTKLLWKILGATILGHADTVGVQSSARSMDHVLGDNVKQFGISLLIWDFGRDDFVDFIQLDTLS